MQKKIILFFIVNFLLLFSIGSLIASEKSSLEKPGYSKEKLFITCWIKSSENTDTHFSMVVENPHDVNYRFIIKEIDELTMYHPSEGYKLYLLEDYKIPEDLSRSVILNQNNIDHHINNLIYNGYRIYIVINGEKDWINIPFGKDRR